jgi:hypothetical protein
MDVTRRKALPSLATGTASVVATAVALPSVAHAIDVGRPWNIIWLFRTGTGIRIRHCWK